MNNRKISLGLAIGMAILLVSIIAINLNSATSKSVATTWERLNQEQMINEMEKDNITMVDLREPELYAEGHIAGAINIPYNEFKSRYQEVNKDHRIIFVCHGGPMGESTSRFLLQKGYANVANLEGGMASWNGPVVTEQ